MDPSTCVNVIIEGGIKGGEEVEEAEGTHLKLQPRRGPIADGEGMKVDGHDFYRGSHGVASRCLCHTSCRG